MDTQVYTVVKPVSAAQYDGTNSTKLDELINDFTVVSEDAATLIFTSATTSYTLARGGWIVWAEGAVTGVYQNDDDFHDAWKAVSGAWHVHDITLTSGPGHCADHPY